MVCRCPVYGRLDGVLFGAAGRGLFYACHAHAPIVKGGIAGGARFMRGVVGSYAQRRFPVLTRLLREALANARAGGPP